MKTQFIICVFNLHSCVGLAIYYCAIIIQYYIQNLLCHKSLINIFCRIGKHKICKDDNTSIYGEFKDFWDRVLWATTKRNAYCTTIYSAVLLGYYGSGVWDFGLLVFLLLNKDIFQDYSLNFNYVYLKRLELPIYYKLQEIVYADIFRISYKNLPRFVQSLYGIRFWCNRSQGSVVANRKISDKS